MCIKPLAQHRARSPQYISTLTAVSPLPLFSELAPVSGSSSTHGSTEVIVALAYFLQTQKNLFLIKCLIYLAPLIKVIKSMYQTTLNFLPPASFIITLTPSGHGDAESWRCSF